MFPAYGERPVMFEDPFVRHMEAMHEARIKELEAYMDQGRKAADDLYANRPFPAYGTRPAVFDDAYSRQLDAEREAHIKEMDARREEARKAADTRRQEAEERFKARQQERTAAVTEKPGA
jgi:hypothetical protein